MNVDCFRVNICDDFLPFNYLWQLHQHCSTHGQQHAEGKFVEDISIMFCTICGTYEAD